MNSISVERNPRLYRQVLTLAILSVIAAVAFAAGLAYSSLHADAAEASGGASKPQSGPRVIYPKRTDLDFEGLKLQGEVRSPGEFYFTHRNEEKFDSLVKRRKNFHQEMLRDAVLSK
jgi:hypothetical protein